MPSNEFSKRLYQEVNDHIVKAFRDFQSLTEQDLKVSDTAGRRALVIGNKDEKTKTIYIPLTQSMYHEITQRLSQLPDFDHPYVYPAPGSGYIPSDEPSLRDRLTSMIITDKAGNRFLRLDVTDVGAIGQSFFVRFDEDSKKLLAILGFARFQKSQYYYIKADEEHFTSLRRRVAGKLVELKRRPEYFNIDNNLFGSATAQGLRPPTPESLVAGDLTKFHHDAKNALDKLGLQHLRRDSIARILLAEMAARARYFSNPNVPNRQYALEVIKNDYLELQRIFSQYSEYTMGVRQSFASDRRYLAIKNKYLDQNGNPINRPEGMSQGLIAQRIQESPNQRVQRLA
ncbi:MAG: hypothetical protein N3E37_02525 [Candidatus Micrarchaeota archaeon]|nr:hypothetical protein [Candidatus Micrarchaeota archaeon]